MNDQAKERVERLLKCPAVSTGPLAWAWWEQYEETAERLDAAGDFRAADDIRTLVDGLRHHEQEARPGTGKASGE